MQSANGERRRTHEEVLAPVSERGGELQIAAERLDLIPVTRAVDRRDEAVDRTVADDRRGCFRQIHPEVAREALGGALDDRVPDDVPGLQLALVCEALHAGRTFDATGGAERILREQAAVA